MYDRCFTSRLCVSLSVNGGYLTYKILVSLSLSLSLYTLGFLQMNFFVIISLCMVVVSHIKFCVSLFLNGGRTLFRVRLSFCMMSVLFIIFLSFSLWLVYVLPNNKILSLSVKMAGFLHKNLCLCVSFSRTLHVRFFSHKFLCPSLCMLGSKSF